MVTYSIISDMKVLNSIDAKQLLVPGLVIGLISTGSGLLSSLMSLIPMVWSSQGGTPVIYLQIVGPELLALCIVVYAWKKPFTGGIALIVGCLVWIILSSVLSLETIHRLFEAGIGLTSWVTPMLFRLLLLVSGLLFLLSAKNTRTSAEETTLEAIVSSRYGKLYLAGTIVGLIAGTVYIRRIATFELAAFALFLGAGLVIFGTVVFARKNPLIGGIVLILESLWPLVLWVLSPLFPSSEALGLAMLIGMMILFSPFLCLPLLASGVCFLLAWRNRRTIRNATKVL